MKSVRAAVFLTNSLLIVNLIGGCMSPQFFRYPDFGYLHPQAELQSYSLHDPFPSKVAGPQTEARPPGFTSPRSIPRQLQERQLLQGMPRQPGSLPPTPPQSRADYPSVVAN